MTLLFSIVFLGLASTFWVAASNTHVPGLGLAYGVFAGFFFLLFIYNTFTWEGKK